MTGGSEVLYTYNRDELISFDGRSCVYDALGNPTTYRSKTATWTHLRNLASLGDTQFTYGADGLRRTKTIGDNEAKYIWAEGKLLAEKRTVCTSAMELPCYPYEDEPNYTYATEYNIQYLYGIDGLTGFMLMKEGSNTRTYYYRKNLQGDITHIFDENNNLKAQYIYDAWGNCKIVYNEDNIANVNPFRYRGYYWDNSVKLYYLKSRWYDPETGRFINADAIEILAESKDMINGLNLYMYCGNNPIMNVDETGYGFWDDLWSVVKWVAVGVVAVVAVAAIVAGTVVTGGALGAVLVGAGIGALAGMGGSIIVQGTTKGWNNIDPLQVLGAGAIGAVVGAVTGIASYAVGALFQTAGSIFGYGLSQSVIAGTKVARVFSVPFLMNTFSIIGKVVGGFVGGTITNFFANEFLGEKYDFETTVKEGFWGEVPNWIIDIFKWLLK